MTIDTTLVPAMRVPETSGRRFDCQPCDCYLINYPGGGIPESDIYVPDPGEDISLRYRYEGATDDVGGDGLFCWLKSPIEPLAPPYQQSWFNWQLPFGSNYEAVLTYEANGNPGFTLYKAAWDYYLILEPYRDDFASDDLPALGYQQSLGSNIQMTRNAFALPGVWTRTVTTENWNYKVTGGQVITQNDIIYGFAMIPVAKPFTVDFDYWQMLFGKFNVLGEMDVSEWVYPNDAWIMWWDQGGTP